MSHCLLEKYQLNDLFQFLVSNLSVLKTTKHDFDFSLCISRIKMGLSNIQEQHRNRRNFLGKALPSVLFLHIFQYLDPEEIYSCVPRVCTLWNHSMSLDYTHKFIQFIPQRITTTSLHVSYADIATRPGTLFTLISGDGSIVYFDKTTNRLTIYPKNGVNPSTFWLFCNDDQSLATGICMDENNNLYVLFTVWLNNELKNTVQGYSAPKYKHTMEFKVDFTEYLCGFIRYCKPFLYICDQHNVYICDLKGEKKNQISLPVEMLHTDCDATFSIGIGQKYMISCVSDIYGKNNISLYHKTDNVNDGFSQTKHWDIHDVFFPNVIYPVNDLFYIPTHKFICIYSKRGKRLKRLDIPSHTYSTVAILSMDGSTLLLNNPKAKNLQVYQLK